MREILTVAWPEPRPFSELELWAFEPPRAGPHGCRPSISQTPSRSSTAPRRSRSATTDCCAATTHRKRFSGLPQGRPTARSPSSCSASCWETVDLPTPSSRCARALSGQADFVYLSGEGRAVVYGSHRENPFWSFRHHGGRFAVTALHSSDQSLFDLVFPDATSREVIGPTPVELVS